MRSSRDSKKLASAIVLALSIAGGTGLSAHRRDEYLQAARIAVGPSAAQIELDLTPGIAVADAIIADIDRDGDDRLSDEEQRTYASLVVGALDVEIDGTRLRMQLDAASFPDNEALRRGEGVIRLQSSAAFPAVPAGTHHLLFRNRHHPDRSVYLANALVPESDRVAVTDQRRAADQSELTIDYTLGAVSGSSAAPLWLAGAAAAAALLAMFAIRRRQEPATT